jgi:hypothetical protein
VLILPVTCDPSVGAWKTRGNTRFCLLWNRVVAAEHRLQISLVEGRPHTGNLLTLMPGTDELTAAISSLYNSETTRLLKVVISEGTLHVI